MKIFVLVKVYYDHYRFQDNVFAHTDIGKVKDYANQTDELKDLQVFNYSEHEIYDNESDATPIKEHLWIQKFDITKTLVKHKQLMLDECPNKDNDGPCRNGGICSDCSKL